jgi:ABC-type tungstate transport system permease subunit
VHRTKFLAVVAATVAVGAVGAATAQASVAVNVYGTTDIPDSNLLDGLLRPAYTGASTNHDTISYTALGTGAAITAAENSANHADALMVHSPSLEAAFVATGDSVEPLGRPIFFNDYVIVGPNGNTGTADPAGVLANAPHDAAKAFSLIATSGGSNHATFLSRNDASGTNTQEQVIWCLATSSYGTVTHTTTTGHCAPGTTTFPSWYAATGLGQGANLLAADSCSTSTYANGECYTMVDRGTFQYHNDILGDISNLEIVSNANSSGAPGGASLLTNPFHAYAVNVSPLHPTEALQLIRYVAGDNPFGGTNFQTQLASFPAPGVVANTADGFPAIASSTFPAPSPCTAQNSTVTVGAHFVYSPPVALPIAGLPVTLMNGATVVAGPTNTDASGNVSFTPNVGTTDKNYTMKTPQFDDSDTGIKSRFSPNNNKQLGTNKNGFVDVC